MKNSIIGIVIALISIFVFAFSTVFSTVFDSLWLSGIFVVVGYMFLIGGIYLAIKQDEEEKGKEN